MKQSLIAEKLFNKNIDSNELESGVISINHFFDCNSILDSINSSSINWEKECQFIRGAVRMDRRTERKLSNGLITKYDSFKMLTSSLTDRFLVDRNRATIKMAAIEVLSNRETLESAATTYINYSIAIMSQYLFAELAKHAESSTEGELDYSAMREAKFYHGELMSTPSIDDAINMIKEQMQ